MARLCVILAALVVWAAPASAAETILERDGGVASAYMYPYSDGGEESEAEETDPLDLFVPDTEPDERWTMPGPFSLLATTPARQTLIVGPSYRNQKFRTELGGAVAYVNSMWRLLPFQASVEGTWVRLKRLDEDRNRRRVRVATNAQFWRRSSRWEGTALSFTGFFQNQNRTFRTWETGLALTQVIGKRLSITGNGFWRRRYLVGGPVLDAGVASFGASYNFGAGVRFGGFYELYNRVDFTPDWGMFLSYQFLPWAEFIVDGGNFEFIRLRLVLSYVLDRP